jgi:trehalose-phosphatase
MSTLLAFDFDGTIAAICDDPSQVRMSRAATTLLAETSAMEGVMVAVVSGREVDDLAARVDVSGAYLVGSHGLEIRAPGGILVRDTAALDAELPAVLRDEILASGLRLESKKHGLALHWRGVPYEAIAPVADLFREWARSADLHIVEGRCVVEAKVRGAGKEEALRWLMNALGATRVIYAGDVLTDFGALAFAASRGRGVFVASDERLPPPGVTVVDSFRELFRLVREEVRI